MEDMTVVDPPRPFVPPRKFDNAAEWLHALGDVPLDRIIFDPWPGTATEKDLLRFCEVEKRLCELIDGTLVEKPMGFWEGIIAALLIGELQQFIRPRNLGLVTAPDSTMRMASTRIRLPDVGFISTARIPRTAAPVPTISPDLVVEVLSETNTRREMQQKLREYFSSGTRLAWYIDPVDRTIAVYGSPGELTVVLTEADTLDGGDVLPGFKLAVSALFAGVPKP